MIFKNAGDVFEYEGVKYTVGEFIYANKNSDYEGLFGVIREIRDGNDKDTENETPDIYCAFENPVMSHDVKAIEKRFSELYGEEKKIEDIALDEVIMAPEHISVVHERKTQTDGQTVYILLEDWATDDDNGISIEVYSTVEEALLNLRLKVREEYESGLIAIWLNYEGNLDKILDNEETRLNICMAEEQRSAVKTALTKGITVITGGPGTGKTLIQHAILDIYMQQNPDKKVCCCAPTGRAARRMEQSTGYPASTIHKALGLYANDDGTYGEPQSLDADLVLVDEVSMLDIFIADYLFEALKDDAQIILIGDADQLPSVGPGAVLSEIIASECVPVVRLDKVFRQNAGSRIATNAKLIRHGNLGLEYGSDFKFIDSGDIAESAKILAETYMREIAKYGVDNVALLAPYRQKTETGVNALNEIIRDLVNPPSVSKNEAKSGKKLFRLGDKVMQIKNFEDISNGDIGYVKDVCTVCNSTSVQVDFGEGKVKWYESDDLNMLDLGYASTIHKSQGSEYSSVIINLQCAHSIMLIRPLIYTAITRGKEQVIIVGERRALCIAINKKDAEKRGTCLAVRIKNKLK